MEQPTRTNPPESRCHCVLIKGDTRNYCEERTSGPDDPFCPHCTNRHLDDMQTGIEVGTYLSVVVSDG